MADEHTVDYVSHLHTYQSFLTLAKYGALTVAIILILMAFFLL